MFIQDQQKYTAEQIELALKRLAVIFPDSIRDISDQFGIPDGVYRIIEIFSEKLTIEDYFPVEKENSFESKARKAWNDLGFIYRLIGKVNDALLIYNTEYSKTLNAQNQFEKRIHKGAILYWISDCFDNLNFYCISKRFMMLALCEDSISYLGNPDPKKTGTYHRLVWKKKFVKKNI